MGSEILCPSCNGKMEKGYVCATAPLSKTMSLKIYWNKKKSMKILGLFDSGEEDEIISGGMVSGEVCKDAFRCPKDKTIVILQ